MHSRLFSSSVAVIVVSVIAACTPPGINIKVPDTSNLPAISGDPDKVVDQAMDLTASGGQPGKIKLTGAIAKIARVSQGGPGSAFSIQAEPGVGWRGVKPALKADHEPEFADDVPAESVKALRGGFDNQKVEFGCSDEQVKKYLGTFDPAAVKLDAKKVNSTMKLISADTVLLCGSDPLSAEAIVSITAREVILVDLQMQNISLVGLVVRTSKLSSYGNSLIGTLGMDGNDTILDGPSIDIVVADALSIEGSLKISAKGSNFKAKKN